MITAAAAVMFIPVQARAGRTHQQIVQQANEEVQKVCGTMQQYMADPGAVKKFEVIDEPVVNAYADDQGTVAIYMGILDFFQSEDELAVVCGHEMAHQSAHHMKRSTGTAILSSVVAAVIGGDAGNLAGNLIYGKESRKHEREADRLGLLYAWKAGYDPFVTVDLWEGMSRLGGGMVLEKYLSTHPVDKERIENFEVLLVRDCQDGSVSAHCDEIMSNPELVQKFNQFNAR